MRFLQFYGYCLGLWNFAAQYAGLYDSAGRVHGPAGGQPDIPGKNGLLLTWLMYAFEALLYVLGIYLGIHPSPDTPTVSFIAFLLAVPLLFVMRPIQHILNVVFFDGIFILTCFLFKSKETLPVDILDGVVFGAVSCIISTFIMLSMHENFPSGTSCWASRRRT